MLDIQDEVDLRQAARLSSSGWRQPLVVGGSGQVGTALLAALRDHRPGDQARQLTATTRQGTALPAARTLLLDLATLDHVSQLDAVFGTFQPDLVLCPGAMTFVDGCEVEPELAWRTNVRGPAVLAAYAHARAVPFVYFSSDYVFDGTAEHKGPYTEEDVPAPLSVYGATKLEGEVAVQAAHPSALIVRTSWVYGPDPGGKNFISALRRQLEAGQAVRVPADQISTPTLNLDLARVTLALVAAGAHGVVHLCGPDLLSRYELARRVARRFGLDEGLLEGVDTASLRQRARRPLHSGLRSVRLDRWLPATQLTGLNEGLNLLHDPLSS